MGNLMGKLSKYKDPLFPKEKVLMGYKARSFVDTGYFYAPYLPDMYIRWIEAKETELEREAFIGAILAAVRRHHRTAWKNKKWGSERPTLPSGRFEVAIKLCADSKIPMAGALPIKDGVLRVRKV